MTIYKLKDTDIRNVLFESLKEEYKNHDSTKIVNEMGVLHGKSRVDIAVINGMLHGYEIKSESDNLLRLPSQVIDYNLVFERMTIVTQRKYLKEVRHLIPQWWGIILVTRDKNGELKLNRLRKSRVNPKENSLALSTLLWRDEAVEVLKEKDLQKGYLSKSKKILYQRISDHVPYSELKVMVSEKLRERQNWL